MVKSLLTGPKIGRSRKENEILAACERVLFLQHVLKNVRQGPNFGRFFIARR
jgi:hypothetical protein